MAIGAGESARAPSEKKVTRLSRVDVAPARLRVAPAPFPGERVVRKEHLMAPRADAIDFRRTRLLRQRYVKPRRLRNERSGHPRVDRVSASATVAGLAADPGFEERAAVEPVPDDLDSP